MDKREIYDSTKLVFLKVPKQENTCKVDDDNVQSYINK